MYVAFRVNRTDGQRKLVEHLARFNLVPPQNCTVTFRQQHAVVSSQYSYALGTALTAWRH
ncbi:hypothetical protein F4V88_26235 [Neorhizobium galegae]|nr:hypothetical protein F4V88_26235 [Neorhizobium galegae]CDZ29931.1 Hypothetical protein NGAL_HAMBI490_47990 [Neorhizobium galegae bv. officinalis]CDZ34250.1 Hypothetical protein NGAL_HAMBI1146_07640 [Neorhizobium galegae bv. officinalis]